MHPYVIYVDVSDGVDNGDAENMSEAEALIRSQFMLVHPYLSSDDVPSEMITPADDIVDSKISLRAAKAQLRRVALIRGISQSSILQLIDNCTIQLCGGKPEIDVIQLNIKLNEI